MATEKLVWALNDRQGSVIDLVTFNTDGPFHEYRLLQRRDYTPFGSFTSSNYVIAEAIPLITAAYTGRDFDNRTGLYDYRSRQYDPTIGSFTQEDGIGIAADLNRYRYVGNSPLNYNDPSGHVAQAVVGAAVGGVLGAGSYLVQWYMSGANWSEFSAEKLALSTGAGIVTGAVASATFGASLALVGAKGVSFSAVSAGQFALAGGMSGAALGGAQGFTVGAGNSLIDGKSWGNSLSAGLAQGAEGAVFGGIGGAFGGASLRAFARAANGFGDPIRNAAMAIGSGTVGGAAGGAASGAWHGGYAAYRTGGNILGGALQGALIEGAIGAGFGFAGGSLAVGVGAKFSRCFPAGTLVDGATGLRPIESVARGDKVWAFDHVSRCWQLRSVLETSVSEYDGDLVEVTVAGEQFESTLHHPFWVLEGEELDTRPLPEHVLDAEVKITTICGRWVDASDLRIGDVLLLKDVGSATITSIALRPAHCNVYNFCVEQLHNYAVGNVRVLVHNSSGERPAIPQGSTGGAGAGKRVSLGVRLRHFPEGETPPKCAYCGLNEATHVDHVIARSLGGDLTAANTVAACSHCNTSKGARPAPKTPPAGHRGAWPDPTWPQDMIDWWNSNYGG